MRVFSKLRIIVRKLLKKKMKIRNSMKMKRNKKIKKIIISNKINKSRMSRMNMRKNIMKINIKEKKKIFLLIYDNIKDNSDSGIYYIWDYKNNNVIKKIEFYKDKDMSDYYKWSKKKKKKEVNYYELSNDLEYGNSLFKGVGNDVGSK